MEKEKGAGFAKIVEAQDFIFLLVNGLVCAKADENEINPALKITELMNIRDRINDAFHHRLREELERFRERTLEVLDKCLALVPIHEIGCASITGCACDEEWEINTEEVKKAIRAMSLEE